jgi:hypothetical protein
MKVLFIIFIFQIFSNIISFRLNQNINSLHYSLSPGYKIIPTIHNINEISSSKNQTNNNQIPKELYNHYNSIKNNVLFNRGINSTINLAIHSKDKDISFTNISNKNIEKCNKNQITEKKYSIYYKDSLPYYAPIDIPVHQTNGISVEVKYGDLSMEIPTPENLSKLYSELRRLKSMQNNDVYYDSSRSEIETQISFYKDKIKEMEFKLKNADSINSKEQSNAFLQSQLQNVAIVDKIGNLANKDYYKDENKTIINADEGRAILGEKYDQTETYN